MIPLYPPMVDWYLNCNTVILFSLVLVYLDVGTGSLQECLGINLQNPLIHLVVLCLKFVVYIAIPTPSILGLGFMTSQCLCARSHDFPMLQEHSILQAVLFL